MSECCQGPNPTGKLCGDCPHKPAPKVQVSAADPSVAAAGMKKLALKGDEPFPGYSAERKIEPTVKPTSYDDLDDEPINVYAHINYLAPDYAGALTDIDWSKIELRMLAFMASLAGVDVEKWEAMTADERKAAMRKLEFYGGRGGRDKSRELFEGYSGGTVTDRWPGRRLGEGYSYGGNQLSKSFRAAEDLERGQAVVINVVGGDVRALDEKIMRGILSKNEALVAEIKGSPPCPDKRYATYEETKGVRCGFVTYQNERGTIFRQERRGWNDRDEKHHSELTCAVAQFHSKHHSAWTPAEARIYSSYRTQTAVRERGWVSVSKKIIGRNGKRTDLI